jgi:hypothetical protein
MRYADLGRLSDEGCFPNFRVSWTGCRGKNQKADGTVLLSKVRIYFWPNLIRMSWSLQWKERKMSEKAYFFGKIPIFVSNSDI